jgi:hypothetical protein
MQRSAPVSRWIVAALVLLGGTLWRRVFMGVAVRRPAGIRASLDTSSWA